MLITTSVAESVFSLERHVPEFPEVKPVEGALVITSNVPKPFLFFIHQTLLGHIWGVFERYASLLLKGKLPGSYPLICWIHVNVYFQIQ